MVCAAVTLLLAVAPAHSTEFGDLRSYDLYNGGKSMPTNQGEWVCDCASGECMGQRSDTCSRSSNHFNGFGQEKAFDVCRKVCDDHNKQHAWQDHECNAFAYCNDGCYFKHMQDSPSGHADAGDNDCTFYTLSQLPGVVENDDCDGCKSEERRPDSELWKLFGSSGESIQKQVEDKAAAMGWNGHFKEFVPVRYAVQVTNGQRFFVKVRVQSQLFIDVALVVGPSPSNAEPKVEGIAVGVEKKAPIQTNFDVEKDMLV